MNAHAKSIWTRICEWLRFLVHGEPLGPRMLAAPDDWFQGLTPDTFTARWRYRNGATRTLTWSDDTSGSIEWRDAHGQQHRSDGPARVTVAYGVHSAGLRWVNRDFLHRSDGPAGVVGHGHLAWTHEGIVLVSARGPGVSPVSGAEM